MRLLKIIVIALVLSLSGCITISSYSPKQAGQKSYQLFEGKPSHLLWVEGTNRVLSSLLANAAVGVMGTDIREVDDLVTIMKQAKNKDVRIAVAGTNSSYTAKIILAALENTPGELEYLQLAFIGFREHEAEVRAAVKAKGGKFLFSDTTRS